MLILIVELVEALLFEPLIRLELVIGLRDLVPIPSPSRLLLRPALINRARCAEPLRPMLTPSLQFFEASLLDHVFVLRYADDIVVVFWHLGRFEIHVVEVVAIRWIIQRHDHGAVNCSISFLLLAGQLHLHLIKVG